VTVQAGLECSGDIRSAFFRAEGKISVATQRSLVRFLLGKEFSDKFYLGLKEAGTT